MNSNWTARWFFVMAPFTLLCSSIRNMECDIKNVSPSSAQETQKCADCLAKYFCDISSAPVLTLVLLTLSLCVYVRFKHFCSNFRHFYIFVCADFLGSKNTVVQAFLLFCMSGQL